MTFLILVFIFSFAIVSAAPSIPETFYGNVYFNNSLIIGTYNITANVDYIDSVTFGKIRNGIYEIDVSPDGIITGKINFFVNGIPANENGIYDFIFGKEIELNLTLDEKPVPTIECGNGILESGELCDGNSNGAVCPSGKTGTVSCNSLCQLDYSSCTSSSSGCSNGGSSGGSSSSSSKPYFTELKEEII